MQQKVLEQCVPFVMAQVGCLASLSTSCVPFPPDGLSMDSRLAVALVEKQVLAELMMMLFVVHPSLMMPLWNVPVMNLLHVRCLSMTQNPARVRHPRR